MANVKVTMEYAASLDRAAREKRLSESAYTHVVYPPDPPKKWVGLTDEDIKDIVGRNDPGGIGVYTREIFKKIEDKLQEKNT